MATYGDRAGHLTATTGTGTLTLGAALGAVAPNTCSYQSFNTAGIANAAVVAYLILDSNGNWEIGTGTYTASGTTLTRTVTYSNNANAAINLSGNAQVFATVRAEDLFAFIAPTSVTTPIVIGGTAASSTLTIESTSGAGTSDSIVFKTGSQVTAMTVDTSQNIQIGGGFANVNLASLSNQLQLSATGTSENGLTVYSLGANTGACGIFQAKTRGTTPSTATILVSGDVVGELLAYGNDGAAYQPMGGIQYVVDGTPLLNNMPSRITFSTNNGGTVTTEACRIDQNQRFIIREGGGASQLNTSFELTGTDFNNCIFGHGCWSTTNNSDYYAYRSHNNTVGTDTALSSGDTILLIGANGNDGSGFALTAYMAFVANAAFAANSRPVRFQVNTGTTTSVVEGFRVDQTGAIYFGALGTTATAGNAFLNSGSSPANNMLRSTSSLRYKRDVTNVPAERVASVSDIRAIEFNSTCAADDPDVRHVGYAAEEVALVDPHLVHWGYLESDCEDEIHQTGDKSFHGVTRVPKAGAVPVPDGVQYERVLLLKVAALEARVKELEAR